MRKIKSLTMALVFQSPLGEVVKETVGSFTGDMPGVQDCFNPLSGKW